jgi:hypothetical protein
MRYKRIALTSSFPLALKRGRVGVQSDEIIEKILENEEAERAIYQLLGRNPQILRCAA